MSFVLIVEDNSMFRQSLRELLSLRFPTLEIAEAANEEEALGTLSREKPDLIFMDIKLAGGSGLELTRTIKANNSGVHVVILTSYDIPEYREAAFQCGASYFFTKGRACSEEIADVVKSTLALKGKDLCLCPQITIS